MDRFTGILGILAVLLAAWLGSTNRNRIRWRTVVWGLGLQVAFAFLVMRWDFGRLIFEKLGNGAKWLLDFAYYGSSFVFGELGTKSSGTSISPGYSLSPG